MCRNIRPLHHFEPPSTLDEMREAALQYVRKVSGLGKPARADQEAFEQAVEAVTQATLALLTTLPVRGIPRTREGERARARARWEQRAPRMATPGLHSRG